MNTGTTTYLHCALTHRVIASRANWDMTAEREWNWIAVRTAEEFGCHEDCVHAVDTDDRLDYIAINGSIVAYIDRN